MERAIFLSEYEALEDRMRERARLDGDVYVPNPAPTAQVDHILVCMEPSLGGFAGSVEEAERKVAAGFRNFLSSVDDFLFHFSVRRYLCREGEGYFVTDLSKGAMTVQRASVTRRVRYDRWFDLFRDELSLVGKPGATVVAVGNEVSRQLERQALARPWHRVLHYSPLAARARRQAILGREEEFRSFANTLSQEDVCSCAEEVLGDANTPLEFREVALSRLSKSGLTESRKMLVFAYRRAFQAIHAEQGEP